MEKRLEHMTLEILVLAWEKTINMLEDPPINIPIKIGANWYNGFKEED
jgi:hypothetical protein